VCDGKLKLTGDVLELLLGSGGLVKEETTRFPPKELEGYGKCVLYGKEHLVSIDYFWYSDRTTDLKAHMSPSPSTAKTFKVGSVTGYIEEDQVRVPIPCSVTSDGEKFQLFEVIVRQGPALRKFDDELGKAFASTGTTAARYLGGEIYDCSAVQSGASSDSSSPGPSNT
jgi:hypothetical protein